MGWLRKIQNPIMRPSRSESDNHFQELLGKHKTDKLTLVLLEETPSGPYWEVMVEGDRNFSLVSDELIINLGPKRPAIRFTCKGMTTCCPKCGDKIRYEFQGKTLNWWCEECQHRKLDEEVFIPSILKSQEMIH